MIDVVNTLLLLISIGVNSLVLLRYIRVSKEKDNEFYTDYKKGNLTLRIYKLEFEYQAIGQVSRDKLLDGGNFSLNYRWALIQN